MDILFEIVTLPIFGVLQAIAALLWPSDDPHVHRLQRICLVLLVSGIVLAAGAIAMAYLLHNWQFLIPLGIAAVLLVISGAVGKRVEEICKGE